MNMKFPKISYTTSGDVSIAYQIWGKGSIDIVLVPPLMSHLEHCLELDEYVQFVRRLSSFSRLILFDKRGQGMSDYSGTSENSLETRMDDVRAVMDAAQSDKAVIIGTSEGGPISILFATTYPERVIALVLYGTFAKYAKSEDFPNAPFDVDEVESSFPIVKSKWGTGIMTHYIASDFDQHPEKLEWVAKLERLAFTPARLKAIVDLNMKMNVYSLLDVISVPTLVLHKKDDPTIPIASGHELHEHIAGSKFVELKGRNHFPYLDDSAEFVGAIEDFLTGQKGSAPLTERILVTERVLATILFTDIVDSTIKASELGDQKWKELLNIHDKISKEQIRFHRGRFIKSTGDGLLATFDGPGRAIMCAKSISKQLLNAGIEIRSGLHTGEIENRDQDIGGISVHIASRIESKADPGEILVSRTVKDLVAGSGVEFKQKGIFELKGIPDSWELFSVI
jgi:pimeloyl-ACP methyl ester carboxylesterase